MKLLKYLFIIAFVVLLVGCSASIPPKELIDARQAYQQASMGQAAQLVPAELHKAQVALAVAEKSFQEDPDSYMTRDLAYVADRKAKMAEGLARSVAQKAATEKANKDYEAAQTEILKKTKEDLAASERSELLKTEQLAAEQKARLEAENREAKALADLAKLVAIKEEARGLVITLSGSVLFASNKSELLPAAQNRLNQVADALLETKERKLTIEGHTDSQGSSAHNQELSLRRANAVRSYLIARGYPGDLIQAQGIGEDRPIADNTSAEGRANNRRVEIVIDRAAK
ncbi:MAG: OmpA family protein [Melioribacteraceae bacterium]|nr:OmpA family protein [Melioribacteraceae bacterium]